MSQAIGESKEASDDEEHDESSSSSQADELTAFRQQWQKELQSSSKSGVESQMRKLQICIDKNELPDPEESVEARAKRFFQQGSEFEKCGRLYEAIQFYKRAEQLVPDIEFRFYESSKTKTEKSDTQKNIEKSETSHHGEDRNCELGQDDDEKISNIYERLSKVVQKNGRICLPHFEQNATHISALPMEIFLYILRWVVSSELDIKSLDIVSRVCRGFFICSRDEEIWKMACVRVWGVGCERIRREFESWRGMYLQQPRLRFNGCYISKTTYIRAGENSFQDQYYQPWHLIEYFRYLRFFPEGKVLMLTSTEDPQACVTSMKNRNPRNASTLVGHYRLHGDHVTLVLKKQDSKTSINTSNNRRRNRETLHDSGEQSFHVEFEIKKYYKRSNAQLAWLNYIIYTKYKNGQETPSELHLGGRYPPFNFNRVKSYTQESEFPLI